MVIKSGDRLRHKQTGAFLLVYRKGEELWGAHIVKKNKSDYDQRFYLYHITCDTDYEQININVATLSDERGFYYYQEC